MDKKWDLTQFLTEAAQIEDTSIQISDMKIPQDVKNLGRQFEKQRPPKNKQNGRGKQPCGYCGQTATYEKGKNCPAYGKKCMKCQKFTESLQFCVQVQGPTQQQEMARPKTRPQASRKSRTQASRQENH